MTPLGAEQITDTDKGSNSHLLLKNNQCRNGFCIQIKKRKDQSVLIKLEVFPCIVIRFSHSNQTTQLQTGLASFALNYSIRLSKRNFFAVNSTNFHRLNCQVLLRSYYLDLPLEKGLFSF